MNTDIDIGIEINMLIYLWMCLLMYMDMYKVL